MRTGMRTGRITASRASDFMSKGKGEMFGDGAKTYAKELVLSRLGIEIEQPISWEMEWGIEHEPDARQIYERSRGVKCIMPGFVEYKSNAGCTPDGCIEGKGHIVGNLEIKCPQPKAHLQYLIDSHPPKKYYEQMQFQMMVTGAEWCDWMTYCPLFPDELKARVIRIKRDEDLIAEMDSRLQPFEDLINDYLKIISNEHTILKKTKYGQALRRKA